MTQLNAAVQQEDFRKAAELKKRLEAINGRAATEVWKRGPPEARPAGSKRDCKI